MPIWRQFVLEVGTTENIARLFDFMRDSFSPRRYYRRKRESHRGSEAFRARGGAHAGMGRN